MSDTTVTTPPASLAPASPAPAPPAAPSDGPAALSPTQQAAAKAMADLRPQTLTDPAAHKKFKEAAEHVHHGGPAPSWLTPSEKPAENRILDPGEINQSVAEAAYAPAPSPSDYKTVGVHLPPDMASSPEETKAIIGGAAEWAYSLKLPVSVGNILIERAVHHATVAREFDTTSTFVGGDEIPDFVQEADAALQHMGGFQAANAMARKYVESVLSPAELKEFDAAIQRPDGAMASLAFDPLLIQKLAILAQARGIK